MNTEEVKNAVKAALLAKQPVLAASIAFEKQPFQNMFVKNWYDPEVLGEYYGYFREIFSTVIDQHIDEITNIKGFRYILSAAAREYKRLRDERFNPR